MAIGKTTIVVAAMVVAVATVVAAVVEAMAVEVMVVVAMAAAVMVAVAAVFVAACAGAAGRAAEDVDMTMTMNDAANMAVQTETDAVEVVSKTIPTIAREAERRMTRDLRVAAALTQGP